MKILFLYMIIIDILIYTLVHCKYDAWIYALQAHIKIKLKSIY